MNIMIVKSKQISKRTYVNAHITKILKLISKKNKSLVKHVIADTYMKFKQAKIKQDKYLEEAYHGIKDILEDYDRTSLSEIESILSHIKFSIRYLNYGCMFYYDFPARTKLRKEIASEKDELLSRAPKLCKTCNSISVEYWDESEREMIFQCQSCGRYFLIPFKTSKNYAYCLN